MPRKSNWILAVLLAVLVAGVVFAGPALADEDTPRPTPSDDEVNAIAKKLFCPVCENIPLDVCGTDACHQWREQIREKLAEGWTEDEIIDYFIQLYGERTVGVPPRRGLNWLLYVGTAVIILAGAVVLVVGFRRWRAPIEVDESSGEDQSEGKDEYISRLEEELKNRQ